MTTNDWPEELATIEGPRFGWDIDANQVMLSFTMNLLYGCAGAFLNVESTVDMLTAYKVRDVKDLNGKPCIVKVEPGSGSTRVVYSRPKL